MSLIWVNRLSHAAYVTDSCIRVWVNLQTLAAKLVAARSTPVVAQTHTNRQFFDSWCKNLPIALRTLHFFFKRMYLLLGESESVPTIGTLSAPYTYEVVTFAIACIEADIIELNQCVFTWVAELNFDLYSFMLAHFRSNQCLLEVARLTLG